MPVFPVLLRLFLLPLLLALGACSFTSPPEDTRYATPQRHFTPEQEEQFEARLATTLYDPWERMNRGVYKFNAHFDDFIFLPVVDTYDTLVPDYAHDRLTSFFKNIGEFRNATNALLQFQPVVALNAVGRFAINSTVGILGFYDPAKHIGMKRHHRDFGQTLASWGAGTGPYLMLPVLGPSNLRDSFGMLVDTLTLALAIPTHVEREPAFMITMYGVYPVNTRSNNPFRYHRSGSPFEYDLIRYVSIKGRQLSIPSLHEASE